MFLRHSDVDTILSPRPYPYILDNPPPRYSVPEREHAKCTPNNQRKREDKPALGTHANLPLPPSPPFLISFLQFSPSPPPACFVFPLPHRAPLPIAAARIRGPPRTACTWIRWKGTSFPR
jgi:hypothetical protein